MKVLAAIRRLRSPDRLRVRCFLCIGLFALAVVGSGCQILLDSMFDTSSGDGYYHDDYDHSYSGSRDSQMRVYRE